MKYWGMVRCLHSMLRELKQLSSIVFLLPIFESGRESGISTLDDTMIAFILLW